MVTFITVLQVNLVMSALVCIMLLAYLCGFQVQSLDRRMPTHDPVNALIIKLLQEGVTRDRPREAEPQEQDMMKDGVMAAASHQATQYEIEDYPEKSSSIQRPLLDIGVELLKQQKRYNSPRVLLSDRPPLQPPPLYEMDEYVGNEDEAGNRTRRKRHAQHRSYRGEYSVCDSESEWVTDKTSAVDIRGRHVAVLGAIKTGGSEVKQYFYETKCRNSKPVKSGCRGIDDKHWSSQCKTTQTYVRALTAERSSVSWRWIRIDTSCVCALSRKKRRT
ncbi:neurotrophin-3-like [Megalops cyprinoides]|uniref:neurotrophin-3-like n=1 Tax=Megalops cyprinoides TaxID=118141 RepID=UPI001863C0E7|nr:neurotrophin-3-like [Megalops cyprinoides]